MRQAQESYHARPPGMENVTEHLRNPALTRRPYSALGAGCLAFLCIPFYPVWFRTERGFLAFADVLDPLRLLSTVLDRCRGLFALQFVEAFGQNADQLVMSVQGLVDVSEAVLR
jgi:hypothetical protein